MKKYCLLFFAGVFALSFSGFSQLKVVSSGNVGVGTSSPGAKLEVTNTDSGIHHCAKFTGPSSLATVLIGGSSQYSDYLLYVSGEAFSTGGWKSSDEVYKKNIQALDGNEVLAKLMKVDGKKYEFKSKSELENIFKNELLDLVPNFSPGEKYGLIAQELEKEFPELVRFDSMTMTRAINYDGMIPVLLEAIKTQQQQIAEMQELINAIEDNCCQNNTKSASIGETETTDLYGNLPRLYQNAPNPFSSQTTIRFEIPQTVQNAQLHICNMTGSLLKTIQLNQRGEGNVIISGNEFNAGMYLYILVIDGRIMDTKQMLLTK
jgi:trimeric autotransporter adhesin